MAHLWIADADDLAWAILELDAKAYDLTSWPPARIDLGANAGSSDAAARLDPDDPEALLQTFRDGDRQRWAVVATESARVAVNGLPLLAGVHVLHDRDELRAGRNCAFFSTERLARIETFAGTDRPLSCPRCMRPIACKNGEAPPVVRCPVCEALYHETPESKCWTHGSTCSLCPQPTSLDSSYCWTPEDL